MGITLLDGQPAQVLAIELEQAKGAMDGRAPMAPDQFEHGEAGLVTHDRFAIDDAGLHAQLGPRP